MSKKSSHRPPKQPTVKQTVVNPDAAGIDLAAEVHYVAVPADRDPQPVRNFGTTTDQLIALADWLQKFGVDLTAVDGVNTHVAYTFLTEVGPDLGGFASPENFSSWLGLCPNNKVSGNRRLSVSTRPVSNRLATALRMAAQSLNRVESPLGDWFRRMRAKLGPAGAVTALAHKLARILYTMIKTRTAFDPVLVQRE